MMLTNKIIKGIIYMVDELDKLINFIQIWNKIDEKNNINSHEKYKQDYVKWKNENKGGKR